MSPTVRSLTYLLAVKMSSTPKGIYWKQFSSISKRLKSWVHSKNFLKIADWKKQVIIDSDVAELYGVETRDINKAVKNNPDKFPKRYVFQLTKNELEDLRWKFSTAKLSKTRVLPKAFTEKGLYMGKGFPTYDIADGGGKTATP